MFRKISSVVFIAAVMAVAAVLSFGQSSPTSGKVVLEKADGTREPVENALIEVYRTDIKSSFPSNKTNKRGEFIFAGFQLGAVYVLSVSAPDCSPGIYPNVKAGRNDILVVLRAGNGAKFTEDEVRAAVARGGIGPGAGGETDGGKMTEEQRKAQAEFEAKKKEVEEKNKKAQSAYETVIRLLGEGDAAMKANDYETAVAKYNEGYLADPDFAGSAPTLLIRKADALRARAVDGNNKAAKNTDTSSRLAALTVVKADLGESAECYKKALDILKTAAAGDVTPENAAKLRSFGLTGVKEIVRIAGAIKQVDDRLLTVAKELIPEYIASESDAAKKSEARVYLASVFLATGDADNAIASYRAVLEADPENVDGMAGLGLSLVNAGYINGDKAQLQEGANYLAKFAAIAPDGHKYKPDAIALIDSLKKTENVTPQKVNTPARRKN
ncbi:MAG: hypothetical protein KF736_13995 [Acidobacteria bacterium]|nr:hypothetical protein [Acidobacteriota bacterium]MCW5950288.1 hypothetical protein [Pyrinomonadaceae bacterium]